MAERPHFCDSPTWHRCSFHHCLWGRRSPGTASCGCRRSAISARNPPSATPWLLTSRGSAGAAWALSSPKAWPCMRAACEATSWSPPFGRRPCRACAASARLSTPGVRFASRNCCMAADSTIPPAACRLLWAPSPVACDYSGGVPHEITREEIDDLIQGFVSAASHVMAGRVRRRGGARRAGLSAAAVHVAAEQPARGRIRRQL